MMERIPIEEKFILGQLAGLEEKKNKEIQKPEDNYHQMSLFTDFGMSVQA